jgi:hypothetical protein
MTTPTTGPTTGPNPSNPPLVIGTQVIPNWISVSSPISATSRETLDQAFDTFERQINVAALAEPCRVTYGMDRLGAQIATVLNYGTSIVAVLIWGRGEVQSVASFTISNATPPGTVLATHYTGTTGQAVDAKLVSAYSAISITHTATLAGIAYSVIELQPGADIGDMHAIVQGRKIYDPRDGTQTLGTPSTYKYSDNPALALADAITNTTYGWGKSIDWTSVTAAANACDALVSGEKKRIIGITLDTRQSAEEWVDILRAHAGCYVVPSPSGYKLVPDATASSVRTFAKADIVKGSLQWAMKPTEQQPNVIEISYTDTSAYPWTTRKAVYPANGIPPGSEELRLSRRNMPGVQRYSQALREAIEMFNHSRLEALQHRFTTFADALAQEPGDVITINDGGLTAGITFRMLSRTMSKKGLFEIAAQKYDPAAFDSSAAAAPSTGNTTLPSASNPPTVGTVTLTEEVVTVPSGALPLSKIRATWAALSTWPFIAGYRVVVKTLAGVTVDSADVPAAEYISPPLNAATTYNVLVYARSSIAVSATASIASISLVSTGIGALASVWSQAISRADIGSWTFGDLVETYQLYPGDNTLRIRTKCTVVETSVYTGANELTPGLATDLLDAGSFLVSPVTVNASLQIYNRTAAQSPGYSVGASRTAVFALLNIANWVALYNGNMRVGVYVDTIYWANASTFLATGSTVAVVIQSEPKGGGYFGPWQIEFDAATIAAMMPTVTDPVVPTPSSSASGGVVVQLPRKYITVTNVQITAQSSTTANPSYTNLNVSETTLANNNLTLHCYDAAGARVAAPCSILITGVPA